MRSATIQDYEFPSMSTRILAMISSAREHFGFKIELGISKRKD